MRMEVSFEGVTCCTRRPRKTLLDNVSGRFLPGELTAILGPSGAGKTTLLNAISGYRRNGIEGHISAGPSRCRCYIGQEDVLAPFLTAGELMDFAGLLKLPADVTRKQRAAVTEEILSSLGMGACVNVRTESLSGGQRRRLSIALELISNPPVLFLDEPTSGLDTVSASLLVHLLSKLSRSNRTIVITIHQPSAALFDLFDRVYFLALGKCVYQGGPGSHLVHFLDRNNFVCPQHYNPADYLIEVIEEKRNVVTLSEASGNGRLSWYSSERRSTQLSVNTIPIPSRVGGCNNPFWFQFSVIMRRIILQGKRNTTGAKLQLIHYILTSLITCVLFYRTANNATLFFSQLRLMLGIVIFYSYTRQMTPIIKYPFEMQLLKREYFNSWHSLLPYYLAYSISNVPYMMLLTLMWTTSVYYTIELPMEPARFFLFYAVAVLTSLIAEGFGLTIGAICCSSITHGSLSGSISMVPLIGLAVYGYDFMRKIPLLMEVVLRTSFMRSSTFAMFVVAFGLDREPLQCPDEEDHCYFKDPKLVLYFMNQEKTPVWSPFCDLCVNTCFFWTTFYLALKWRLRR